MSKLNKDSVGEGVGVCFLQPMITFIMFLCHIAITCDSYIHNCVCTQARGQRAQIHTTQMQTCVSLWFMLHFVSYTLNCLFWLNWCLRNLLELLERAGFFNNCILCTCEMCGCTHLWKSAKRGSRISPLQRDVPQGSKANQRHQQPCNEEQKKPVFEYSSENMSAQDRGRPAMGNTAYAARLPVPTLERTGVKI